MAVGLTRIAFLQSKNMWHLRQRIYTDILIQRRKSEETGIHRQNQNQIERRANEPEFWRSFAIGPYPGRSIPEEATGKAALPIACFCF